MNESTAILASTYPVELESLKGVPKEQRPVYIFRRATNSEYLEDDKLYNSFEKFTTKAQIIQAVMARFELRLQAVKVNYDHQAETGNDAPEFMDILGTLDYTQLAELFTVMHMSEVLGVTDKKKFKSLFTSDSAESAEDATQKPAEGGRARKGTPKSRKSSARNAKRKAAKNAKKPATTT